MGDGCGVLEKGWHRGLLRYMMGKELGLQNMVSMECLAITQDIAIVHSKEQLEYTRDHGSTSIDSDTARSHYID